MPSRLVLIGNGFDLAHGLKTSYKNFIDWYMCRSFTAFKTEGNYADQLISITTKYSGKRSTYTDEPRETSEVLACINRDDQQSITFISKFLKSIVRLQGTGWVDIEREYFNELKKRFRSNDTLEETRKIQVEKLNSDFSYIIELLTEYINTVNDDVRFCKNLSFDSAAKNFTKAFQTDEKVPVTFLNFNYTETLAKYVHDTEVIHIHGRAEDPKGNPIIFGYGDETDAAYQEMEDSDDNAYLEHIKSFAYYKTPNYRRLIDLIDSDEFETYIFGHSCGLSDRVLLSEIFEHKNCKSIEVFYHRRSDGSDNFKEVTQGISRHFSHTKKGLMRRRIKPKDTRNIIPQV
jgi:hypothetical protein